MEFRLLGPLEASDGNGALPLGGPKQRTLLAHLLLQANRIVTSDRLIEAIWEDEPPMTARNTIQTYIRHLRRTFGAERIQHRSGGYVLEARPQEVDVLRFDALLEEAKRLASTDLPGAASTLREALLLWRGPALDDLSDQGSLRSDIARLEERRMVATEDRIAADLALGAHRELIPELEALVGRHPLRERLWGQLMVALYRSGRQGDALAAYHRAREILADQLGIDPSPELRQLQDQILRQDSALAVAGEPLRGYRLLKRIGQGAHGVVWLASQPHLAREVAVKAINPAFANDPEFVRRFEAEAQTVARLEHPHIVPLYDYWREPDGAYLVMRYLRGGSAEDLLDRGPLELDVAGRLLDQVAGALSTAHRQGVIHRDVKPSNVLLDDQGNAYLSDFGIARDLVLPGPVADPEGLLPYVSPEVLRGEPASAASDVYSLGVMLHRSLVGRRALEEATPASSLDRQGTGPLPSINGTRRDVPDAVDRVVRIATATDPGDRYDDPLDLATAFRQVIARTEVTPRPTTGGHVRNPFKGLRSFTEADAPDFFGRERATAQLTGLLSESGWAGRFLAVVGPSGSGKSSLVRAGLLSAIRLGRVPGSERWFVTEMAPGADPFRELEAALLRIAATRPAGLLEELERDELGLLRAVDLVLPADHSELVLVVDQFEEVFTMVGDEARRALFLSSLVAAATDPRARLRVVATLRADFYDRPLLYRGLGDLLATRTYAITPMSAEEMDRAITGPAERAGMGLEPRLVAEMVADLAHQPAALPLLQFALTELFDRRRDGVLTLEAYHRIGGASGAVARRADEIYQGLGDEAKAASRQLFLRLVTVGEQGSEDARRRVLRAELDSMEVDSSSMDQVVDAFGSARLLSFDRDPASRGPTVEVAHEALLEVWARLRGWVESAREDMRMHRRLAGPASEWEGGGRDPSFLLGGARLDQFEGWAGTSGIALTGTERGFLEASSAHREAERSERERSRRRERTLERRSRVRLRALVAVLAVATLIASSLTIVAVRGNREAARQGTEALLSAQRERAGRLTAESLAYLETDPELSLLLALYAVDVTTSLGEPVPSTTVEALHWALQQDEVEYPVESGPTAVVAGPLGTRAVFDLPLGDLVKTARSEVARVLTPAECERFLGMRDCPSLPSTFPPILAAEPIHREDLPGSGHPLAGTEVTVYAPDVDPGVFAHEFEPFTASTGIKIRLTGARPGSESLTQSTDENRPDVAFFAGLGDVSTLAQQGHLVDLDTYLDRDRLIADQSPYLVSLGTVGDDGSWPSSQGGLFAAFVVLFPKSLLWYPVPEFTEAGYAVPTTWSELMALGDRIRADGRTPWCMGWEAGGSTGWPGTDWIENLVLGEAGPAVYDQWTFHQVPFDSPVVRRAFQRLGSVLFTKGSVRGGPATASRASFGEAQQPMVETDPPGCWLYQFPSFASQYLPEGSEGATTAESPFPTVSPAYRDAVMGSGLMMAAFSDRPEVREVVRYILSPEHDRFLAGLGLMPANRRFDVGTLPLFWRPEAEQLQAALATDLFRFDASDLMPVEIGASAFWEAMMTYAREGPDSLDGILAGLDAAWPDDG